MALVTTAEVKRRLPGFDTTDTDSDTLVTELIAAADEVIAVFLGYPQAAAGTAPTAQTTTYTRYFGGSRHHFGLTDTYNVDSRVLILDVTPVTSISSIHDDSQWDYDAVRLVASADYIDDGDTGRVYLTPDSVQGAFSQVRRAVKAVFVAGWVTVPSQIKEAALHLIAHWFELSDRRGRSNIAQGGTTTTWRTEALPESVEALLTPYILGRAL